MDALVWTDAGIACRVATDRSAWKDYETDPRDLSPSIVKRLIAALIALPLLLPVGRVAAQAAPAEALPSVTLPPELERVLRDYERAWRAGDAAALAALFTPDGFVLQPNRPPVRGHAELERRYSGQGGSGLRLRALAYATADTVGYIIGAYGYGDTPGDLGKFTLTLRRAAGRWLIFSDMDNGNAPPRRPPSRLRQPR